MEKNVKIISDNAVEAVAKSESLKDKLLELWQNACISELLTPDKMWQNLNCNGNGYCRCESDNKNQLTCNAQKYLSIPFEDAPKLVLARTAVYNHNEVTKKTLNYDDSELKWYQVLNRFIFKVKYTYEHEIVTGFYEHKYILSSGMISTEITEEQFNKLSDFYFEQRYTKLLNADLMKLTKRYETFNVKLLN